MRLAVVRAEASGGDSLILIEASQPDLLELQDALGAMHADLVAAGPSSFHSPEYFPRFLVGVEDLIALVVAAAAGAEQ